MQPTFLTKTKALKSKSPDYDDRNSLGRECAEAIASYWDTQGCSTISGACEVFPQGRLASGD